MNWPNDWNAPGLLLLQTLLISLLLLQAHAKTFQRSCRFDPSGDCDFVESIYSVLPLFNAGFGL